MKKSIFILILCFIQGACASADPVAGTNQAWAVSQQIEAEISVRYELLDATSDIGNATARNEVATN